VRQGVIEALIEQCDETGAVPLTALGLFSQGIKVRITSGPFTGQIGEVDRISAGDRVMVLLNFMGVQTSLPLPPFAVEAA
jgi:transcription antitermination factor NusG